MDASTVSLSEVEVCSVYFVLLLHECFACCILTCLTTCCSLHVLPVPHWADLVGEGRASEERGLWFSVHCLRPSIQQIWYCCANLADLFFRRSLRLRPGRLKQGSSAVLEWIVGRRCLSENFGWLSVASFISVLLARTVTLISVCTAYTIRNYEWSVCGFFPYLYWWWCQCSLSLLIGLLVVVYATAVWDNGSESKLIATWCHHE